MTAWELRLLGECDHTYWAHPYLIRQRLTGEAYVLEAAVLRPSKEEDVGYIFPVRYAPNRDVFWQAGPYEGGSLPGGLGYEPVIPLERPPAGFPLPQF